MVNNCNTVVNNLPSNIFCHSEENLGWALSNQHKFHFVNLFVESRVCRAFFCFHCLDSPGETQSLSDPVNNLALLGFGLETEIQRKICRLLKGQRWRHFVVEEIVARCNLHRRSSITRLSLLLQDDSVLAGINEQSMLP